MVYTVSILRTNVWNRESMKWLDRCNIDWIQQSCVSVCTLYTVVEWLSFYNNDSLNRRPKVPLCEIKNHLKIHSVLPNVLRSCRAESSARVLGANIPFQIPQDAQERRKEMRGILYCCQCLLLHWLNKPSK